MSSFRSLSTALAVVTVAACGASPVRADVTIVAVATMSMPGMTDKFPPSLKAAMKRAGRDLSDAKQMPMTEYIKAGKIRTDNGAQIIFTDKSLKKMVSLYPLNHTYVTLPFNAGATMNQTTATVLDTGETKIIMGHQTRHYIVTGSNSARGTTYKVDAWSALDIPRTAEMEMAETPGNPLGDAWAKVKGMPLLTSLVSKKGNAVDMTFTMEIKSISYKPLPNSLFVIPAGYKPMTYPGMPGGK